MQLALAGFVDIMLKAVRRTRDLAIEGRKARQYDDFSRRYRMKDLEAYADLAIEHVPQGGAILDVATGPGYFCIALGRRGRFAVRGLDISRELVEIARENARRAGVEAEFVQGNASAMQFRDRVFDLVFCSWAMKNFMAPAKVLNEMHRVLKPGGTAMIIDLNHDATGEEWDQYSSELGLKGMTALIMKVAFRIQRSGAYSRSQFDQLIQKTAFGRPEVQRVGINLCLYLRK